MLRSLTLGPILIRTKQERNLEFVTVRNDVPEGEAVGKCPSSGVERAGGARGQGLIEHLRQSIRVLEQVPVSLAVPPAPDAGPSPRPACSFFPLDGPAKADPFPGKGKDGASPFVIAGLDPAIHANGTATCRDVKAWMPGSSPGMTNAGRELPWSRLAAAGLHEIKASAYRDQPAALAFALACLGDRLAKRDGGASPLLWCSTEKAAREWGSPYGPGLLTFGLDPALFVIVQARNGLDAAWALEEGLKSRAFISALGQIEVKAPLIARRLGLAAQTSRTPCLLLSGHRSGALPGTLTRWRVAGTASRGTPFDPSAPGDSAWHLTLERCRGIAAERSWIVEFGHGANGVRLASRLADRAAEAGEQGQALFG